MSFKQIFNEGRDSWMVFSINKGKDRWSFKNLESNSINYIKINPQLEIGSIQKFLEEILATPSTMPKTKGIINYSDFAVDVVAGKKSTVYIKKGMFEKIKKTWLLDSI